MVKYPTPKDTTATNPNLQYSKLKPPYQEANDLYVVSSVPYNSLARSSFQGIARHEPWSRRAYGHHLPLQTFADRVLENVRNFDAIFSDPRFVHYTRTPIVLYRGTDLPLKQPYPFEYTDNAYISTSTNSQLAREFAAPDGVVSVIHVPAGIPYIAGQNPDQFEVTLPRGLTFRSVPSDDEFAYLFVIPSKPQPLPAKLGHVKQIIQFPVQQFSLPSSRPIRL